MALIFIAIPTKGTVTDGKLNEKFLAFLARLHTFFPGNTFISPMVQDYALLKFMPDSPATWEAWGHHCKTIIERSDEVWVLQFEGWDTSVGVNGEMKHAREHDVPVAFIGIPEEFL